MQQPRNHLLRFPLPGVDFVVETGFNTVVLSNIVVASKISIPKAWYGYVMGYFSANKKNGAVIIPALFRNPTFYLGGWIMSTQPGAGAMTLDKSIFVSKRLSLSTYVHELVHVIQYALLGITNFLVSYFGISAATVIKRWLARLNRFTE